VGPLPVAALGALGVVVTAVLTLIGVRLKLSGRIDTTEANVLWTATESLRQDLAEQLRERESVIIRQTARMLNCEQELSRLREECQDVKNKLFIADKRRERTEEKLQRAEEKIKELKGGDYGEQRKSDREI
jgi:chromosome segregation ATPase